MNAILARWFAALLLALLLELHDDTATPGEFAVSVAFRTILIALLLGCLRAAFK